MTRLRFRTIAASPIYGTVSPGQIVAVPDECVEDLLSGGYAERVDPVQPVRESARLTQPEKAVLPDAGAKRPGK